MSIKKRTKKEKEYEDEIDRLRSNWYEEMDTNTKYFGWILGLSMVLLILLIVILPTTIFYGIEIEQCTDWYEEGYVIGFDELRETCLVRLGDGSFVDPNKMDLDIDAYRNQGEQVVIQKYDHMTQQNILIMGFQQ